MCSVQSFLLPAIMLFRLGCALLGVSIGWAQAQATGDDGNDVTMGPAAFMWPADRPWSADVDNIAPCGSHAAVGNRTNYPLSNGRLALVLRDDISKLHVSVAYNNDPSESDFEEVSGPGHVGDLDPGHSCLTVPDPPSDVTEGSNATFRLWYEASPEEENGRTEDYYACADVTFVTENDFTESIPCFNATEEDPGLTIDPDVNVTLTSTGSESSSSDDLSSSEVASHIADASDIDDGGSKGLSKGGIAGVVVGSVVGVGLIIASAIFFIRYRRANSEARRAKQAAVSKFDIELASHNSARPEDRDNGRD
ncbi:hypothetical protein Q7P37_008637 [Cladosporium fusiforme]